MTDAKPDDALAALAGATPPAPPPIPAALEAELANLAPVAMRRPFRQLAMLVLVSLAVFSLLLPAPSVVLASWICQLSVRVGAAPPWVGSPT